MAWQYFQSTIRVNSIAATAGLPRDWSEHSYGEAFPEGSTNDTVGAFVIQAYGTHPFGESDELHFVRGVLNGDVELTTCLSPLLASQRATVGLMLRADDTINAPMVALSVSTNSAGERPQWVLSLLSRENAGETVRTVNILTLDDSLVKWGRIIRAVWLRLSRVDGEIRAYLSKDGLTWMDAGKTSVTKGPVLACSGLGLIPAQVTFEQPTLRSLPRKNSIRTMRNRF